MATGPIVAIVGQTATGKSAVAVELAEKLGGEIICADSRTIYKGMDIGTAKPSAEDRRRVVHHGLDLISPDQNYSAYDFQQYALAKIEDIQARGHVPFLVGGSGLYVDGVLYGFDFGPAGGQKARHELSKKTLPELQSLARKIGLDEAYPSFQNPRHLAGAIARGKITLQKKQLPANAFLGAIRLSQQELDARIEWRVDNMIKVGLVDEVRVLIAEYGHDAPGLSAPIYEAMSEYILGNSSLQEAAEQAIANDRQLAKRQLTWFKRNHDISWVQSAEQLKKEVTLFLTKI